MAINHAARACLAWPVLTNAASSSSPFLTYGQLASAIGVHHRAVRYILGLVQNYCLAEKLPPLTILVINAQDGMPGSGFIAWDVDDLAAGIRQVTGFNWSSLENPFSYAAGGASEDELAETIVRNPAASGDVYARVKVRGIAQSIFRKALLKAYGGRCAFCGLAFADALQAAHILPWSESDSSQRMAVSNGLLLCGTHHSLFDSGLMTLGPDHEVVCDDFAIPMRAMTKAAMAVTLDLDGAPAFIPSNPNHRPAVDLLARRNSAFGWDF